MKFGVGKERAGVDLCQKVELGLKRRSEFRKPLIEESGSEL